jgi:hypothetical protein
MLVSSEERDIQELLAPLSVVFYSSQHKKLGDKKSLAHVIHEITRIPIPALDGHALDTFSTAERMAWSANRQTTKDEDGAYCLLGIFNIFMPLIYGEGKDSALKRLQREIDGLPVTGMVSVIWRIYLDRLSRPYPFGRIQKGKPLRAPLRHAKDQNTKSEGLCTALTYIEVIYSMPAKRPGHDRNTISSFAAC